MELSREDMLRLQILFVHPIHAIRIDESKMMLYALSEQGEAKIQLHPHGRDEPYLHQVRDVISHHVLGLPGGYPTYLKRWNRMGQTKGDSLEHLLKLGEPEAVVAVVNAPGLTPELARRAWWAMPESENARSMLRQSCVVQSDLGKILAKHLVEHLPFEEEVVHLIESVRLVLQGNLISEETKQQLWERGQSKNHYWIGFLWTLPNELPHPLSERWDAQNIRTQLAPLVNQGNPLAQQLVQVVSSAGQTFLNTCERVLSRPANQEVVNLLFEIIAKYFERIRPLTYDDEMNLITLIERASFSCDHCLDQSSVERREIISVMPEMQEAIRAMLILSGLRYSVLRPVFSRTTALGTLMRKKLAPVVEPILEQFALLQDSQPRKCPPQIKV